MSDSLSFGRITSLALEIYAVSLGRPLGFPGGILDIDIERAYTLQRGFDSFESRQAVLSGVAQLLEKALLEL